MEDIDQMFDETIKVMRRASGRIGIEKTGNFKNYIDNLCFKIEGQLRGRREPMPARIAGNINNVLFSLRNRIGQVNETELLSLTEKAISDLEIARGEVEQNEQESTNEQDALNGMRVPLNEIEAKAKEREKISKDPIKRKEENEEGQKDYQDIVGEALEEIKRQIDSYRSSGLTAEQISRLDSVEIMMNKLPIDMQAIHDKGVHETTKMIETEIDRLQNGLRREIKEKERNPEAARAKSLDSHVLDENVLDAPWDLQNYGTTREKVNQDTNKMLEDMREGEEKREDKGEKTFEELPGDIIK